MIRLYHRLQACCEFLRVSHSYLTQASLAVERKLGKGANYLSVDYTMVRGIKLYRMRNINAPLAGPAPYRIKFHQHRQFESSGRSRRHRMTVSFQTTVGQRMDLWDSTVSKALDDTSGMFSLPANIILRPEFGRADYDRRTDSTIIGNYRLPGGFRSEALSA